MFSGRSATDSPMCADSPPLAPEDSIGQRARLTAFFAGARRTTFLATGAFFATGAFLAGARRAGAFLATAAFFTVARRTGAFLAGALATDALTGATAADLPAAATATLSIG